MAQYKSFDIKLNILSHLDTGQLLLDSIHLLTFYTIIDNDNDNIGLNIEQK